MALPDEDGGSDDPMLPSVVHYDPDGSGIVVGKRARDDLAAAFPEDTIASVKRFMGRGPADAEAHRKLTPYQFAPGAAGRSGGAFQRGRRYRAVTPVEVSAEILRVLKDRAERALGARWRAP